VSDKHCGFIVNKGNATSKDVMDLVRHIQKTVKDKFNVELQTEIRIVGEQ
jgi:UDP-N-acetylmuramate dehydrogenase